MMLLAVGCGWQAYRRNDKQALGDVAVALSDVSFEDGLGGGWRSE